MNNFLINLICSMSIKGLKIYMDRLIVCVVYLLNWVIIQSYPSFCSYLHTIYIDVFPKGFNV